MQEEVHPHHKISLSDDGNSALLLKWGQKNKDREEVPGGRDETFFTVYLQRCDVYSSLVSMMWTPPHSQLRNSPKPRPTQAEHCRHFLYLLWERPWLRRHFLFETIYPASVRKSQWEPPAAPGVSCLLCEMPTPVGKAEQSKITLYSKLSEFRAPQLEITPGRLQPLRNHVTFQRLCFL